MTWEGFEGRYGMTSDQVKMKWMGGLNDRRGGCAVKERMTRSRAVPAPIQSNDAFNATARFDDRCVAGKSTEVVHCIGGHSLYHYAFLAWASIRFWLVTFFLCRLGIGHSPGDKLPVSWGCFPRPGHPRKVSVHVRVRNLLSNGFAYTTYSAKIPSTASDYSKLARGILKYRPVIGPD